MRTVTQSSTNRFPFGTGWIVGLGARQFGRASTDIAPNSRVSTLMKHLRLQQTCAASAAAHPSPKLTPLSRKKQTQQIARVSRFALCRSRIQTKSRRIGSTLLSGACVSNGSSYSSVPNLMIISTISEFSAQGICNWPQVAERKFRALLRSEWATPRHKG